MGGVDQRLLDVKVSPQVVLVKLDQVGHKLKQGTASFCLLDPSGKASQNVSVMVSLVCSMVAPTSWFLQFDFRFFLGVAVY